MHKRKVEKERQRAGGSERHEQKNRRGGMEITLVSLILFMLQLHWGNSMFPYQSDC